MSAPCWYFDSNTLINKGANAEALRWFGYSIEEFLGLSSIKLLSVLDAPRMLSLRKQEKWGVLGTFTFVRKDGSLFSAGLRWHQGDYRGTLCDCMIIVPSNSEAETSIEAECECNSPTR